jgi:hypothetical protein
MRTHTLRLSLAVLAATVALAACKDQPLQPRGADAGSPRKMMAEPDQPIDDGGGGGGGDTGGGTGGGTTTPPPPFNPPPPPFAFASNLPVIFGGVGYNWYHCEQIPHVGIAFSNDVTQGTTLYAWGVSVPGSHANFGFYNQAGQLVKTHATQSTHDNCVIYHEPETISTWDMAPGYYFVYSSYWSLSPSGNFDNYDGYPFAHQGRYITTIRIR